MTDSNCRRWIALSDQEATGEPLTELERLWYAQHAASCSECAREGRFWAALGEVMSRPEVLDTTLLPTSVGSESVSRSRRWQRLRPLAGWLLAAAASVALVVSGGAWLRQRPKVAAAVVVPPPISFVAVAGETRLGSKSVRIGEVLRPGERLRTEQGRVCFVLDTSILACLDANSEASVSTLSPSLVSVRLERGRLMSRLERQPAGRSYVVTTSKASVMAKGTEFVVGVDAKQGVSVHLHQGQLAIVAFAHQARDIHAPSAIAIEDMIADVAWSDAVVAADRDILQLAQLSRSAQPREQAVELDVMTRPQGANVMVDDMLLGPTPASASIRGGHRLVVSMPGYATITELLPTEPGERLQRNYELAELAVALSASADESAASAAEPALAAETPASSKPHALATAPLTPRGLLARAQALRADGKQRECATVYRQLVASFSSSDEARVALVSLGELELGVLGQPAQALHSFEAYLQLSGPLTREARFGRIRALQMLSRKADEQVAIAAFLRDYPNSVQAERLRRRVQSRQMR